MNNNADQSKTEVEKIIGNTNLTTSEQVAALKAVGTTNGYTRTPDKEDDEDKNSWGKIHFNLINNLHRQGKYSQIQFTIYVACRANIPNWAYSHADIKFSTGLHNEAVKQNCLAFLKAGIFVKAGLTRQGSPRYKLIKAKFNSYMESNEPLDVVTRKYGKRVAAVSNLGVAAVSNLAYTPRIPTLSAVSNLPYPQCLTDNKDNKEERKNTTTKSDGDVNSYLEPDLEIASDASLSPKVKTDVLRQHLRYLNTQGSNYTFTPNLQNKILSFFTDNTQKSVSDVAKVIEDAECIVYFAPPYKGEGVDHQFYCRKATNLTFLFDHIDKTIGEIAAIKGNLN